MALRRAFESAAYTHTPKKKTNIENQNKKK